MVGDLRGAISMDQSESARFIVWMQAVDEWFDEAADLMWFEAWPDLHADRVSDATEELDVCAIWSSGPHADPREVC